MGEVGDLFFRERGPVLVPLFSGRGDGASPSDAASSRVHRSSPPVPKRGDLSYLPVPHHGKAEEGAVRGEVLRFHAGGTGAGRASWEKQQGAGRGRHPRSPLPGVWHIAPGWLRLIQELQVPGDVTLAKRFFGSHYL